MFDNHFDNECEAKDNTPEDVEAYRKFNRAIRDALSNFFWVSFD
jgi:hypothetical protein